MRAPLLALFAATTAVACATNPATGAKQLILVSESQEIAMGRDYDKQVVGSIGLYPDTTWQRYIQEVGARLAATSERPSLPWTFRVVDGLGRPLVATPLVPPGLGLRRERRFCLSSA